MQELLSLLNDLIVKYSIEDADVAALQEALSKIENDSEDEFTYVENEEVEE